MIDTAALHAWLESAEAHDVEERLRHGGMAPSDAVRLLNPSPRCLRCVIARIVANGGFQTSMGAAPADCGVLARSATRRCLFEEGFGQTDDWPDAVAAAIDGRMGERV